ncbi:acylphosphatase [Vitiosangium sp. GDMCC 1.1324]|uniref:acylphosphatase n=1 Tax=Vitiosangium sp. (strain GDMCC 1.1324) TaxID=2138576 RepID=UPI000D390D7A|nr:acylphosphatase [Vitiosangium sp. GDMCC 1.1324]PTL78392.1 acylphosphatase [Vitiosangium sp. GDMCC 1.1324]
MDRRRASLRIRGKVQGVFYRESARTEALRLGLTGWVRNLSDGSVEAVAEGAPESIEAFITWCRRGPTQARVSDVERADEEARGEFTTFTVERSS